MMCVMPPHNLLPVDDCIICIICTPSCHIRICNSHQDRARCDWHAVVACVISIPILQCKGALTMDFGGIEHTADNSDEHHLGVIVLFALISLGKERWTARNPAAPFLQKRRIERILNLRNSLPYTCLIHYSAQINFVWNMLTKTECCPIAACC